jgi:hypothetical protein
MTNHSEGNEMLAEIPRPEFSKYGIDLYDLGEGRHLMTFGAVDIRRFLAAANAYERELCGNGGIAADDRSLTYAEMRTEVVHRSATLVRALPDDRGEFDFWLDWSGDPPILDPDDRVRPSRPVEITVWSR